MAVDIYSQPSYQNRRYGNPYQNATEGTDVRIPGPRGGGTQQASGAGGAGGGMNWMSLLSGLLGTGGQGADQGIGGLAMSLLPSLLGGGQEQEQKDPQMPQRMPFTPIGAPGFASHASRIPYSAVIGRALGQGR